MLLIGALIRSSGNLNLLFLGTAFIGIGIAICNVLLPAIVKQRYPYKVGIMTSIYSTSMGLCAATASGLSIPLAKGLGLGWHKALLVWGTMALIAAIIWFPQVLKFAGKHGLHSQQAYRASRLIVHKHVPFFDSLASDSISRTSIDPFLRTYHLASRNIGE